MQDLFPQSKAVFWGAVLLALALAMVPSLAFFDAAGQYLRFVLQWDPGTIPVTRTNYPLLKGGHDRTGAAQELRFVEFVLKAPKAKLVTISGDFNDWQPEPMSGSRGRWQLLLPLPPGRYQYAFQVDGLWTPDPGAKETAAKGELKTSIRQVR